MYRNYTLKSNCYHYYSLNSSAERVLYIFSSSSITSPRPETGGLACSFARLVCPALVVKYPYKFSPDFTESGSSWARGPVGPAISRRPVVPAISRRPVVPAIFWNLVARRPVVSKVLEKFLKVASEWSLPVRA